MEVPSFMVKKVKRGGLAALNPCTNVQWMKAAIHCVHSLLFFLFLTKARFVRNKKKAATQGCCFHQSGVGGVRTLVQTMGTQAFYMLIS